MEKNGVKKSGELKIRLLDDSKDDDRNYGGNRGSDPYVDITRDSTDQEARRLFKEKFKRW